MIQYIVLAVSISMVIYALYIIFITFRAIRCSDKLSKIDRYIDFQINDLWTIKSTLKNDPSYIRNKTLELEELRAKLKLNPCKFNEHD